MAKISKQDLIHLSNSEIKLCFTTEDRNKFPSPVKEFVDGGKDTFTMGNRINRVEKLMMNIIIDRFLNGQLSSLDEETIKLKAKYNLLSELESEFPKGSKHKVHQKIEKMMDEILSKLDTK